MPEKWTITIETANTAFDDYPTVEVARILRQLAYRVERDGLVPPPLFDINGNSCGTVLIEKDPTVLVSTGGQFRKATVEELHSIIGAAVGEEGER